MQCSLEIRGNHVIWHRNQRALQGDPRELSLSSKLDAVEGSFGRDIYFHVPRRNRMRIYAVLCFLVSMKFYLIRELVAGFIMLTAASAAILVPLSILFAVYKGGQKLAQREGIRSVLMNKVIRFPGKDRQLDELLSRAAANQVQPMILAMDPEKAATRNGLILITALPRRAS